IKPDLQEERQQGTDRGAINSEFRIQNSEFKITHYQNKIDWGEAIDVSIFRGRQFELETLQQWIIDDHCRLVALLGMGGIGKTSLAIKLAQQMQEAFDAIIWRSLRNAPSLAMLLSELVQFVSHQQDSSADIRQLMHYLRASRCLLILDNVETILEPGKHAGHYRPEYEGYGELFRVIGETPHQSCLILTSREKPMEIATLEGSELSVRSLALKGCSEAAQALLEAKGLSGSTAQKQHLAERYSNSPLAVKLVATSIQDLFDGEIEQFLAQDTVFFNSVRYLLSQQFERLSPLEATIMCWLAINREWTTFSALEADLVPPISRVELLEALESLSWRALIEKQSGSYTQQPVVMEYMTDQLLTQIANEFRLRSKSLGDIPNSEFRILTPS
ncbi:MAG: NB-ARC domain-containing protein, partial [Microcystaceae cyanobacterium]